MWWATLIGHLDRELHPEGGSIGSDICDKMSRNSDIILQWSLWRNACSHKDQRTSSFWVKTTQK